ncbi:MAG: oxidoreductase [Salinarimonas sp.]
MPPSFTLVAARIAAFRSASIARVTGLLVTGLLVMPLLSGPASAQPGRSVTFVDAQGEVVAVLDREALEAVGRFEVRTNTPWDDDPVSYEGPLLRDLVDTVGFGDSAIIVHALNDYSSEIPSADIRNFDVILALRKDGEYMPIADMGPAFVVYPYDFDPRLRDRVYYARSVWQVSRIRQLPVAAE